MATDVRGTSAVHELYHLARGTCSGILFAIPAIYTMELWWLAFDMPAWKLVALLALTWLACVGLIHEGGMTEDRASWPRSLGAAFEALAMGLLVGAGSVLLLGLADGQAAAVWLKMVALLSAPVAVGYAVAASLLGRDDEAPKRPAPGGPFWRLRDLGLVAAGCLFVGLSIAPIEETLLVGPMLSPGRAAVVVLVAWAYAATISYVAGVQGRRGRSPEHDHAPPWSAAFNILAVGLLTSAAMTYFLGFGDGDRSWGEWLMLVVALALPGTVGGAAGRLIL